VTDETGASGRRRSFSGRLFGGRRDRGEPAHSERTAAEGGESPRPGDSAAEPSRGAGRGEGGTGREPSPPSSFAGGIWTDTHAHLQDLPGLAARLDPEPKAPEPGVAEAPATGGQHGVEAVLTRAGGAGVVRVVCVGTDLSSSRSGVKLAQHFGDGPEITEEGGRPELYATVGLHPQEAKPGTAGIEALLAELSASVSGSADALHRGARVVGVGECGLDYHYDTCPWGLQKAAFANQIGLAKQYDLTLVIHARDAWEDLFDILATEHAPPRAILHCFTGGPDEARRCLDLGLYLSFSGIVTFKSATAIQEAAKLCPADQLLLETDAPFLTPVPFRGKTNESRFVPVVGQAVAELRETEARRLALITSANASRAFALPTPALVAADSEVAEPGTAPERRGEHHRGGSPSHGGL